MIAQTVAYAGAPLLADRRLGVARNALDMPWAVGMHGRSPRSCSSRSTISREIRSRRHRERHGANERDFGKLAPARQTELRRVAAARVAAGTIRIEAAAARIRGCAALGLHYRGRIP
jgi:hypothetical protein